MRKLSSQNINSSRRQPRIDSIWSPYYLRTEINRAMMICCWSVTKLWTVAHQAPLLSTVSGSFLKFMSFKSVMLSNQLIFCHPLLLLPSIFPSIRVFSNELVLYIRWPKNWSLNFSISPSNEYSGLISFRIDWFDLLQGTLKSFLQHYSSKASVLQLSALFMVQLWHLPVSKHLLISWPQSLSAVILESKEIKSVTAPTFSSSISHEVMRPDDMILVFFKCWVSSQLFQVSFSLSSFTLIKGLIKIISLRLSGSKWISFQDITNFW